MGVATELKIDFCARVFLERVFWEHVFQERVFRELDATLDLLFYNLMAINVVDKCIIIFTSGQRNVRAILIDENGGRLAFRLVLRDDLFGYILHCGELAAHVTRRRSCHLYHEISVGGAQKCSLLAYIRIACCLLLNGGNLVYILAKRFVRLELAAT